MINIILMYFAAGAIMNIIMTIIFYDKSKQLSSQDVIAVLTVFITWPLFFVALLQDLWGNLTKNPEYMDK
jgi:hypothetical protein